MKKLSDYKGEEAIELWGQLLEPLTVILSDEKIIDVAQSGKPIFIIAKTILEYHAKEAEQILLQIDSTPIDGLNIVLRLVAIITEIINNDELKRFFGFAEQVKIVEESIGSVTENTEANEI